MLPSCYTHPHISAKSAPKATKIGNLTRFITARPGSVRVFDLLDATQYKSCLSCFLLPSCICVVACAWLHVRGCMCLDLACPCLSVTLADYRQCLPPHQRQWPTPDSSECFLANVLPNWHLFHVGCGRLMWCIRVVCSGLCFGCQSYSDMLVYAP